MSFLEVYFPLANVSANILVLLCVGLLSGTIGALFGIGGGFLVLPYLSMLGVPINIALTSSINQMTAGTLSSFVSYSKMNRVDFKMGFILLLGGIIGIIAGYELLNLLVSLGHAEFTISLIFAFLLFFITITAFNDVIRMYLKLKTNTTTNLILEKNFRLNKILPYKTYFVSSHIRLSVLVISAVGFTGGFLVALLGIGGGIIMVPIMIYGLKLNERFITGTVHFQIFTTSIISTFLHSLTFGSLDMVLSFYLIIGSVLGSRFGAFISTKLNVIYFRIMFALIAMVLCFGMFKNILIPKPESFQVNMVDK